MVLRAVGGAGAEVKDDYSCCFLWVDSCDSLSIYFCVFFPHIFTYCTKGPKGGVIFFSFALFSINIFLKYFTQHLFIKCACVV